MTYHSFPPRAPRPTGGSRSPTKASRAAAAEPQLAPLCGRSLEAVLPPLFTHRSQHTAIWLSILAFLLDGGGSGNSSKRQPYATDSHARFGMVLSDAEYERICRGAVSLLFNRPMEEVKVTRREGSVVYLAYTRGSDKSVWRFKCRIQDSTIEWGNDDNRWRFDERLSFSVDRIARTFTVKESFSDGSARERTFPL